MAYQDPNMVYGQDPNAAFQVQMQGTIPHFYQACLVFTRLFLHINNNNKKKNKSKQTKQKQMKRVIPVDFTVDPTTGQMVQVPASQRLETQMVDPNTGQIVPAQQQQSMVIGPDGQPVVVASDGQQMVIGPDGQYVAANQPVICSLYFAQTNDRNKLMLRKRGITMKGTFWWKAKRCGCDVCT